jgi:cytochrome b561
LSGNTGLPGVTSNSRLQIGLHWAVVAMIATQWATSGAIPRTHNPLLPPSPSDLLLHRVHNYNGMAIGCLVLVRIALRFSRCTDGLQPRRTPMELAALAVHCGIYASLAAQAATGFVASYVWGPAAGTHKAIWKVTLVLIALHMTAAAWHGFRRDGVVGRMLPLWTRTISGERQHPVR